MTMRLAVTDCELAHRLDAEKEEGKRLFYLFAVSLLLCRGVYAPFY